MILFVNSMTRLLSQDSIQGKPMRLSIVFKDPRSACESKSQGNRDSAFF